MEAIADGFCDGSNDSLSVSLKRNHRRRPKSVVLTCGYQRMRWQSNGKMMNRMIRDRQNSVAKIKNQDSISDQHRQ
jgi:hypothetical protein